MITSTPCLRHGAALFRDALIEEAGRLHDDDERQYFPVIVMVASGDSPEGSTSQQPAYDNMLERMIDNLATVHTRMLMDSRGGGPGQQVQVGINVSDLTHGTYKPLAISTAFRHMLPELGRDIARKHRLVSNQYRLTYAPPDGISNPSAMRIKCGSPPAAGCRGRVGVGPAGCGLGGGLRGAHRLRAGRRLCASVAKLSYRGGLSVGAVGQCPAHDEGPHVCRSPPAAKNSEGLGVENRVTDEVGTDCSKDLFMPYRLVHRC